MRLPISVQASLLPVQVHVFRGLHRMSPSAMHLAFCTTPQFLQATRRSALTGAANCSTRSIIRSAASPGSDSSSRGKGKSSKSKRSKRPRSSKSTPGFSAQKTQPEAITSPTSSQPPSELDNVDSKGRDLQKKDAAGISLENRLREEIAHPLRKPKLTLFGALAFSGTLGLFFALARVQKDGAGQVAQNVAVDLAAIALFGWLAWREVQFGRRSLNSLAGRPEARDLQVVLLDRKTGPSLPLVGSDKVKRLGELFKGNDVIIAAGRATDLRKYLSRCSEDASGSAGAKVVALPTDINREAEEEFDGAIAVASGEADYLRDWVAWVGEAVPPRKNIALFKISAGDDGLKSANSYVVAVSDPSTLPLPVDAKRELSEV